MARDKAKDDLLFNCSEEHEKKYVASLYENTDEVYVFLEGACTDNMIHYSTHKEVYELIRDGLGYPIPI